MTKNLKEYLKKPDFSKDYSIFSVDGLDEYRCINIKETGRKCRKLLFKAKLSQGSDIEIICPKCRKYLKISHL